MTQIPLMQAFEESRDRLMAIFKLAMPDAVQVKPFAGKQTLMPFGEMVVPSMQTSFTRGGQQDITLAVEFRVWCGKALEGADGELQNTIYFNWLPSITETFLKYGRLAYPAQPTSPSWLNEGSTGLQRVQVIADTNWIMVFYWQLAFKTRFVCL